MVDGRRHDIVLHREAADECFNSTGSTEQVAGHTLCRRDVELVSVLAKELGNGLHLRDVAHGGRCAVHIDVVDVLGLHFSVFKGSLHHEVGTESFGV